MGIDSRILVIFTVLIIFISAGCCGSSSSYAKDGTTSNSGAVSSQQSNQPLTVSTQQTLVVRFYSGDAEITVDDVIRGNSANSIVEQGNMFNPEPDTGYEYILYNVRVKNTGDDSLSIMPLNEFPLYANGVKSDLTFAVLPENYHDYSATLELLAGGETNGWIVSEVPVGSNVKMAYEPLIGDVVGFVQF